MGQEGVHEKSQLALALLKPIRVEVVEVLFCWELGDAVSARDVALDMLLERTD